MSEPDIAWLFESNALKIAPGNKPFWYTSGLIGPYYINTHFLCGGEERAAEILKFIEAEQSGHKEFHSKILAVLQEVYAEHEIYRGIVDSLLERAQRVLSDVGAAYVSGGQRRDWFFSPILADKLELPVIYLYKDLTAYDSAGLSVTDLSEAKVLHVADLLTVGSSYTDRWVPIVQRLGGKLASSLNVVDRLQGGEENLRGAAVAHCEAIYRIDLGLFEAAKERGYIDGAQLAMARDYIEDPQGAMEAFIKATPEFLEEALKSSDDKTRMRAETLVEKKLYCL